MAHHLLGKGCRAACESMERGATVPLHVQVGAVRAHRHAHERRRLEIIMRGELWRHPSVRRRERCDECGTACLEEGISEELRHEAGQQLGGAAPAHQL